MTKEQLQIALNIEQAIFDGHQRRYAEDILGHTQYNTLEWHSEQRIAAIYKIASDEGWILENQ